MAFCIQPNNKPLGQKADFMKKALVLLALIQSTFAIASSIAPGLPIGDVSPFPHILNAPIRSMRLDPNFAKQERISGGGFTINLEEKTISLVLNRKWFCPPNALCSMQMPAPMVIELPIISMEKDSCNIVRYIAKKDLRPVDGAMKVIRITDVTNSTCPTKHGSTAELGSSIVSRVDAKTYNTMSYFYLGQTVELRPMF